MNSEQLQKYDLESFLIKLDEKAQQLNSDLQSKKQTNCCEPEFNFLKSIIEKKEKKIVAHNIEGLNDI